MHTSSLLYYVLFVYTDFQAIIWTEVHLICYDLFSSPIHTHFNALSDPPLANETAIRITVDPETATVTPGAQQTFTCEANSTATLRWTFNGGLLAKNVFTATTGDRNSTLTIMGATPMNAGVYACLGHSTNEAFSDVAIATVEFYGMCILPFSHIQKLF